MLLVDIKHSYKYNIRSNNDSYLNLPPTTDRDCCNQSLVALATCANWDSSASLFVR